MFYSYCTVYTRSNLQNRKLYQEILTDAHIRGSVFNKRIKYGKCKVTILKVVLLFQEFVVGSLFYVPTSHGMEYV